MDFLSSRWWIFSIRPKKLDFFPWFQLSFYWEAATGFGWWNLRHEKKNARIRKKRYCGLWFDEKCPVFPSLETKWLAYQSWSLLWLQHGALSRRFGSFPKKKKSVKDHHLVIPSPWFSRYETIHYWLGGHLGGYRGGYNRNPPSFHRFSWGKVPQIGKNGQKILKQA